MQQAPSPIGFEPAAVTARLKEIGRGIVDGLDKKDIPHLPPWPLGEIGSLNLNILNGDTPFPLPSSGVRRWSITGDGCGSFCFTGASLAPHAKTTMSPHLFAVQAENGCWGLTVATAAGAGCGGGGMSPILMANQLVSPADILALKALQDRFPALLFHRYVDASLGAGRDWHAWRPRAACRGRSASCWRSARRRPHRLPFARSGASHRQR